MTNEGKKSMPVTRAGMAKALGVSKMTVVRMEQAGTLLPTIGERDIRYYSPDQVVEAAAALGRRGRNDLSNGEIAAQAFQMFDQGRDLTEVVQVLKLEPDEAQVLWREWEEPDFEARESQKLREESDRELRDLEVKEQQSFDRVVRDLARETRPRGEEPEPFAPPRSTLADRIRQHQPPKPVERNRSLFWMRFARETISAMPDDMIARLIVKGLRSKALRGLLGGKKQ